MPNPNIKHVCFAALMISLFLVTAVSADYIYYSIDSPKTSPEGLSLFTYKILGNSEDIYPGDEITAKYLLHYDSNATNQIVIDQPGGLYFDVTSPDGNVTRLGRNYIGKSIYPDDYYAIVENFSPNMPGIWKITPGYTVLTSGGMTKTFGPSDWYAEINVKSLEEPKPDLVIENISADFDRDKGTISRISYTIKNTGDADAEQSTTEIYIDGMKTDSQSSTGYLPAGKSITIFEPADSKYSGSTSFIKIIANSDLKINESDYSNNEIETVVENPGSEKISSEMPATQKETAAPTEASETNSPASTVLTGVNNPQEGYFETCFICGVVGVLSVLVCVLSFALGYYYGLNKNCEREVRWMRSKIEYLKSPGGKNDCPGNEAKDEDIAGNMEEKLEKAIEELKNNEK
ncbi:archaellum component FlaF (FlaF/FlaG flagellin family) [Methanomicrobium sp. W14]|uniref:CARDB domain-containing protein n=1 Tax=Methanomicrobium sp. W14 TaxID=2817839 RepID=UPI001AE7702B|nr:CARDB domain-containing protein [Methanomicrobium sp. W14]MBP2132317.1 archaellum component FlaF (FlaF/FlaG flagellin family) [Methanomicrobium sp. W14]